ncbi:DUF6167 family protein [Streptomyces physcomitrii]|uniref:Secreted protein n=1 Tax=Streptomyces physcomitrii TaxID=2724184 RepID=A0ABX1H9P5_9ACTN|nr:DUF6167 family protein [Streptomyces physcomitrii]NKI43995.1 hypothetical protein [Streptomyces physcomitrii]
MFRRTFWFTAGAAAGVWATTKVNRKIQQLTPESLAAQAANKAVEAGHRLKDFALDVRHNMAQRESELGEALGIGEAAPGQLPAAQRVIAPDHVKHSKNPTFGYTSYSYNRNEDH